MVATCHFSGYPVRISFGNHLYRLALLDIVLSCAYHWLLILSHRSYTHSLSPDNKTSENTCSIHSDCVVYARYLLTIAQREISDATQKRSRKLIRLRASSKTGSLTSGQPAQRNPLQGSRIRQA